MAKQPNETEYNDNSEKENTTLPWLTQEDYDFYIKLPDEYKIPEIREMLHEFEKWRAAHDKRKYRNKVMFVSSDTIYAELSSKHEISAEEKALENDKYRNVCEAIDMLPSPQKRRLIAHYIWGYNLSEIGRAEGVSHTAVAKSLKKAIARLKVLLKDL